MPHALLLLLKEQLPPGPLHSGPQHLGPLHLGPLLETLPLEPYGPLPPGLVALPRRQLQRAARRWAPRT